MKLPYGIFNFKTICEEDYFYQDRTGYIPLIEHAGMQLLFLRPRRFGKSLLVSMLEHYYDIRWASKFEQWFGNLEIGRQPTPLHNTYMILHWDFSVVKLHGDVREIEASLHRSVVASIRRCARQYQLSVDMDINDAVYSLSNLLSSVQETGHKLYLFIDEYDNFANEILMSKKEQYEALMYGDGAFRTLFKAVKAATGFGLDRVFITGVSPVAMSDITSGYNVAKNIYLEKELNTLCGFTEAELLAVLERLCVENPFGSVTEALQMMRTFYNGYCFSEETTETVYNPTLCLYFLDELQRHGRYPRQMLDDNLSMDRNRLVYLAGLLDGEPLLIEALSEGDGLVIPNISRRFGIEHMLKERREKTSLISLFYYFGILTLAGYSGLNKLVMKIPNLVVRSLYIEQLQELYLVAYSDQESVSRITDILFLKGDVAPVCEFIETRLFHILSTRDYRWSNELAIKVMFMTVLFNDGIYMMVSETEVDHGYADLSLIVRPDMRRFNPLDLVFEFKYVGLKELGLTGVEVKAKSQEELMALPLIASTLAEAEHQVNRYAETLKTRYTLPGIRAYAVVAIGLERLVYKTIGYR